MPEISNEDMKDLIDIIDKENNLKIIEQFSNTNLDQQ